MATAAEIRSITSVLRQRTRSLSLSSASSSLELRGAIARAAAALTQGRPSGLSDSDWRAFTQALRDANAAQVGSLRPSPFGPSSGGDVMEFTLEETGLEPQEAPGAPAPSVFDEIIGTVTGRPSTPSTPAQPSAPGKVAQAAEAVTSTASSMWQGVKQAVGLPAEPAPASALPSQVTNAAERLYEAAGAQGVTPQQAAAVVRQQAAAVQRQAATPFYLNPVFLVASTVGSIGLTWLIVKAFSKPKAA